MEKIDFRGLYQILFREMRKEELSGMRKDFILDLINVLPYLKHRNNPFINKKLNDYKVQLECTSSELLDLIQMDLFTKLRTVKV